jgi:hypothetical protein
VRQTSISFAMLKAYFEGAEQLHYPRCMLVNEVGDIAREGGNDAADAQKVLATLLASDEESDRWIAIRHLSDVRNSGKATPQTLAAIATFESNPVNADVLPAPVSVH